MIENERKGAPSDVGRAENLVGEPAGRVARTTQLRRPFRQHAASQHIHARLEVDKRQRRAAWQQLQRPVGDASEIISPAAALGSADCGPFGLTSEVPLPFAARDPATSHDHDFLHLP